MQKRNIKSDPLNIIKRGRPEFVDRQKLKTCTMTICLSPETKDKFKKLAEKQNQKQAAMARILIENGITI